MTAEEFKQGVIDSLIRVAERFGVPVVLLGVMIWLGREAAITLHGSLIKPVVESHVQFLETTSETLREISAVQGQQATTLQELAHGHRELREQVKTVISRPVELRPQN
jgi:hypothetical protein